MTGENGKGLILAKMTKKILSSVNKQALCSAISRFRSEVPFIYRALNRAEDTD